MNINFEDGGPGWVFHLDEYPGIAIGITASDRRPKRYIATAITRDFSKVVCSCHSSTFGGLWPALDEYITRHLEGREDEPWPE